MPRLEPSDKALCTARNILFGATPLRTSNPPLACGTRASPAGATTGSSNPTHGMMASPASARTSSAALAGTVWGSAAPATDMPPSAPRTGSPPEAANVDSSPSIVDSISGIPATASTASMSTTSRKHGRKSTSEAWNNFTPLFKDVNDLQVDTNSKGYDMAKLFSAKLTHISPVWYDLKSDGKRLVLEGEHNFDAAWVSELQSNGSLVLPRVVLEAFPAVVLLEKKQKAKAIDLVMSECREKGYDGIVLESWSRWAAYGVLDDPKLRYMALEFVKQLGEALHSISSKSSSQHLELIYVIPDPRTQELNNQDFGPDDLLQLADSLDGFSLMTYDFSGPQNPGPSAPLKWVQHSLTTLLSATDSSSSHSRMVFLGINFYGNDFLLTRGSGGGAITGRDFLHLLEKYKPSLQWDDKSLEHYFIYSDGGVRHAVFYPTLMSLSVRLNEAENWGSGLSIWEIGQGLDYFFDAL